MRLKLALRGAALAPMVAIAACASHPSVMADVCKAPPSNFELQGPPMSMAELDARRLRFGDLPLCNKPKVEGTGWDCSKIMPGDVFHEFIASEISGGYVAMRGGCVVALFHTWVI